MGSALLCVRGRGPVASGGVEPALVAQGDLAGFIDPVVANAVVAVVSGSISDANYSYDQTGNVLGVADDAGTKDLQCFRNSRDLRRLGATAVAACLGRNLRRHSWPFRPLWV